MTEAHTKGLHRGYADNLRVEWDRRGKSGHSSVTLLNAKKRPVAVLLGDYVPGECDADMDAAALLFCAASDLLEALKEARTALHHHYVEWDGEPEDAVALQLARAKADAAILKATSTEQGERG